MNFKDCYTIALEMVDEDTTATDTIVLDVIKNGVNQGYMLIASTIDRKLKTIDEDFDKVIALPIDIINIEQVEHDNLGYLGKNDYKKIDNNLYMQTMGIDSGALTITYSQFPAKLVADNDLLVLKDANCSIPAVYGAYKYQLYKKKYSASQLLLAEFNSFFPSPVTK